MTLVVGLTGGIASGKSTVARLLGRHGARVVDADQLARRVVEPGSPALEEIGRTFGQGVITPEGTLDRARLGELVFADERARRSLEAILHPRIAEAFAAEVRRAEADSVELLVYEAALLVETGARGVVDLLVVVTASPEAQRARLEARDGLRAGAAQARMDAQIEPEARIAAADHVIENDGTLADLERQVSALLEELLNVARAHTP